MTIRQLQQLESARTLLGSFSAAPLMAVGAQRRRGSALKLETVLQEGASPPGRPDATVLHDSIPLFYIGQNRSGLWVAREAEGRSGGVFLFKRSAMRFAEGQSAPSGCAVMFVEPSLELEIQNQSSFTEAARAPGLMAFAEMVIVEWRKLVAQISRALAAERRNRHAIEQDLFHGWYRLGSKNDDDLPIP